MKIVVALLALTTSLAGQNALIHAIRSGDDKAVVRTLKNGANANEKDAKGVSALMYAAMYGPADTMKLLLARGADVNAVSAAGGTALMTAVADMEKVRLLVEKGANVNVRSAAGSTPLLAAARLPGGSEVARYLLSRGAQADGRVVNSAVGTGKVDLARQLLDSGVSLSDQERSALVDRAAGSGNEAMLEMVLQRGMVSGGKALDGLSQRGILANAAYWGMTRGLQTLIEKSVGDINAKDSRGRTPLMYAAGSDTPHPETVGVLLKGGADASIKDVRGDTALDWARLRNDPEVVRVLGGTVAATSRVALLPASDSLPSVKATVQRAISVMEPAGPAFFKANGCISCHNQSIVQMAAEAVAGKGIHRDEKVRAAQIDSVLGVWSSSMNEMWESRCALGGGAVATMTYGLIGLAWEKQPATPVIDAAVHCLASSQGDDGTWRMVDQRSPLGFSSVKYTALAVQALRGYMLPGRKVELEHRIARARKYLETVKAFDTQDIAFQILGLKWAGGSTEQMGRLAETLVSWQRPDGGWAQHPEMNPDAFATAEAAWALWAGAGRNTSDPAYQKGVLWLRRTQKEDGSWHVRSRGFGFQPYRETGFPHGHDQWLSMAATGFSVLALAPAIEQTAAVARR